jgi:hypothetical protein
LILLGWSICFLQPGEHTAPGQQKLPTDRRHRLIDGDFSTGAGHGLGRHQRSGAGGAGADDSDAPGEINNPFALPFSRLCARPKR